MSTVLPQSPTLGPERETGDDEERKGWDDLLTERVSSASGTRVDSCYQSIRGESVTSSGSLGLSVDSLTILVPPLLRGGEEKTGSGIYPRKHKQILTK